MRLVALLACCALTQGSPTPVILDVDASGFYPFGLDVDDDLAVLFAAAQSHRVQLLGVTTTFGNAPLEFTHLNTLYLRQLIPGKDWPVIRGAPFGATANSSAASDFIAATVLGRPARSVTVITLGAATNLANALRHHPDLGARIGRVVMMSGSNLRASDTAMLELNLLADPRGAREVLKSQAPKLILPLESCAFVALSASRFQEMKSRCCPPEAAVAAQSAPVFCALSNRIEEHIQGTALSYPGLLPEAKSAQLLDGGMVLWDVLAVAAVTNPELFGQPEDALIQVIGVRTERSQTSDGFGVQVIGKPMENQLIDVMEQAWCQLKTEPTSAAETPVFTLSSLPLGVLVPWMLGTVLLIANASEKLTSGILQFGLRSGIEWFAFLILDHPMVAAIIFVCCYTFPVLFLIDVIHRAVGWRSISSSSL